MKDELEDLAFAELYPDARASILARLDFLRDTGAAIVPRIEAELQRKLAEGGLDGTVVSGREKSPYSIWRKMQRKNVAFEQLSDIMAFRVLVDGIGDCYHALGVIHSAYHVVPGRFKDYISTPKPNNYRSLHTGIIGPEQQRIEVQIRTREMHEVAELGVAAHWTYKQGAGKTEGPQYRWLRELLDILEHASGPEEFLEHTKLEMFQDQVFCFTPEGRSDRLAARRHAGRFRLCGAFARSATPASAPRSTAGWCRCAPSSATAIRSRSSPRRRSTPSPTWERFVVTGKARARIRRFVRTQQRAQYLDLGKAIVQKAFRQEGHEFSERPLEAVLKTFNCPAVEDLYVAVGQGLATGRAVINAAFPQQQEARAKVVSLAARAPQGRTQRHRGGDPRPDPRHGAAFRRLLPPAARRPHRRHRHHRQGGDHPHHRLRHAWKTSPTRPSAGSTSPGAAARPMRSMSAGST